jgi:ribonucleoside-diphosphate reductase beta chain
MILALYRQNKFRGIGEMFRYTLRDESNHIEVFRNLFMDLIEENQDIWTEAFREDLRQTMSEAVKLEKEFIKDCLPVNSVGLTPEEFLTYIDYIGDRRLDGVGLEPLNGPISNPLPWLAEMMDIKKEQNFFEGRVTEYQKASALGVVDDDEL